MTNVITLANIAALRAYAGTDPVIWVEGYTSAADGGEGMFAYVGGSATDNGGTIIVTTSTSRVYAREYNDQPLNVCWFGAPINNSSADSAPALLATLAALPAAGGAVYFPPGVFTFNSAITYTIPNPGGGSQPSVFPVHFIGSGQDATILNWPDPSGVAAGITINASSSGHSVHFRDMSITTGYHCTTTAITVNQTYPGGVGEPNSFQSDFTRLTFCGYPFTSFSSPYPPTYWGFGLAINGLSTVNYDSLLFFMGNESGNAITINGVSQSAYSTIHNLSKITIWYGAIGVVFGSYVQGVTVNQCNFTFCENGISVPSGQTGCAQLAVTASQFACINNGIIIASNFGGLFVQGNLFDYPLMTAIAGVNASTAMELVGAMITGNYFYGDGGTNEGIITGPTGGNPTLGVVSGNIFKHLNVGVDLSATLSGWNIQANVYSSVTIDVMIPTGSTNSVGVATN